MVTLAQVADYMTTYISEYRRQYEHFTMSPPDGPGFPEIKISPYLGTVRMTCFVAKNGVVVLDDSEPEYDWKTVGGVTTMLVTHGGVKNEISSGQIPVTGKKTVSEAESGSLEVVRCPLTISELAQRLIFGAPALPQPLRVAAGAYADAYWLPIIIRDIGFLSAETGAARFVNYCEILLDVSAAAWDGRSVWPRVRHDLRRDFGRTLDISRRQSAAGEVRRQGGISLQGGPNLPNSYEFYSYTRTLEDAADGLENLLKNSPHGAESIFHNYIRDHPILLDVYGTVVSKPQFRYPAKARTLNKDYVEPDFIIDYGNQTYKLVELERPDHRIQTRSGHPSASATHPTWQVMEWRQYISRNYNIIESDFPGITGSCPGLVVISRDSLNTLEGITKEDYMDALRHGYDNIEFWTYDDIVERARRAIRQMDGLSIE